MGDWLDRLPWSLVVIACLSLGLAPFAPPHLVEKARWLSAGRHLRPIDWLDVFWHGWPWALLLAKAAALGLRR